MNTRILFALIVLLALTFTRFYNLDITARFTEDESKDLVGVHQLYVDKKLTLVGPTNEQGTKVFSSLTFYMLLPGAILGRFDPVSPVYSSAFWGVLTAVLILILTYHKNIRWLFPIFILTLLWFPLLETSRWAWNPNLIPFWVALALVLLQIPNRIMKLVAGFSLGMAIHAHYYSIFSVGAFLLGLSVFNFMKRDLKSISLVLLGALISVTPFILFDLRHPPGLFLSSLTSQSQAVSVGMNLNEISAKIISNFDFLLLHYTQSRIFSGVLGILTILVLLLDLRSNSKNLMYAIPWIFQPIALALVPQFFPHYLIPSLIFFLFWVILKRRNLSGTLSFCILLVLILGGLFSVRPQLISVTHLPPISVVRKISSHLISEIQTKELKNVNVAVLASPDRTISGKKYRDLLLVNNTRILTKDEYFRSDHLFVISISGENYIRQDPAYEIHNFRSGPLVSSISVDDSGWYVYHFTRGIPNNL